ncbi:T9SS type A sorting domain-containing protein [Bacteroidota bacterium]
MKPLIIKVSLFILLIPSNILAQDSIDYVSAFKDTLTELSNRSDNDFFKLHCQSIIEVITARSGLTYDNISFIQDAYEAFNDTIDTTGSPKKLSSYLNRIHPFTLSWYSPTDGKISISWFHPPKNWDITKTYPLYVQLHGAWGVADNLIDYLTWPYLQDPSSSFAFEDGYYLAPWGRGNEYVYEGISETDIWECIDFLAKFVKIDTAKRYICGHSNGGKGAAYIGYRAVNKWAALGLHAAAITNNLLKTEVYNILSDMPIYFVCGEYDGFIEVNQMFYDSLLEAGNTKMEFVTFDGGHEYRQEDVERMYNWMKGHHSNTSIEDQSILSNNIIAYPNPFKSTVNIKYDLTSTQNIKIEIFNNLGQQIEILVNEMKSTGNYTISWTPNNLPSGIYYYRILTNGNAITKKVIYQK